MTTADAWKQLAATLATRSRLPEFLEVLGRSTVSYRAIVYCQGPNGEGSVEYERIWPEVQQRLQHSALADNPPTTLTKELSPGDRYLAIQRLGISYAQTETEFFELAATLLDQAILRWDLEDSRQALETKIGQLSDRCDANSKSAMTWERRYQALDSYSRGLTHHCLTASRSLSSLVKVLKSEIASYPPATQECVRKLDMVAYRGDQLARSLLDNAKATADQTPTERLSLPTLFTEVQEELQPLIRSTRAQLERSPLPTIAGRRHQWKSLFHQLLTNSLLYRSPKPHIRLDVTSDVDDYHFIVSDNGPGVQPDLREVAFQPFRRLHASDHTTGAGLGLTICREIVSGLGGKIWLTDPPDGPGLSVHFTASRFS